MQKLKQHNKHNHFHDLLKGILKIIVKMGLSLRSKGWSKTGF